MKEKTLIEAYLGFWLVGLGGFFFPSRDCFTGLFVAGEKKKNIVRANQKKQLHQQTIFKRLYLSYGLFWFFAYITADQIKLAKKIFFMCIASFSLDVSALISSHLKYCSSPSSPFLPQCLLQLKLSSRTTLGLLIIFTWELYHQTQYIFLLPAWTIITTQG